MIHQRRPAPGIRFFLYLFFHPADFLIQPVKPDLRQTVSHCLGNFVAFYLILIKQCTRRIASLFIRQFFQQSGRLLAFAQTRRKP